ncbi:unnamed protein product, partial [Amoebophrya sp. A120]|eukprot:GSA120T00007141001.1
MSYVPPPSNSGASSSAGLLSTTIADISASRLQSVMSSTTGFDIINQTEVIKPGVHAVSSSVADYRFIANSSLSYDLVENYNSPDNQLQAGVVQQSSTSSNNFLVAFMKEEVMPIIPETALIKNDFPEVVEQETSHQATGLFWE